MHASKDSMWREMWKILQIFLGSKQGLNTNESAIVFILQKKIQLNKALGQLG
jgi:hypothetical protein